MKETQHIEWKETWRDECLRWICGFANAEGGVLVIGRNDKGKAVGVKDASRLLRGIPNKVRDIPGIMVDVNLVEEAGKETLEIVVEPYLSPVSYKGEYHYRSGSTKQALKGAALDRFLLRKQGRHWDGVPVPYVTLADLDDRPLAYFRKSAEYSGRLSSAILQQTDADLIDKLHLMKGRYLTRAAVLLFHPDPERFVTGAFVKIGYFLNDADLLYQDEVHGDLFTQVNETVDRLLIKYLKARISYEGIQRVETYPVPEEALREAVTNAIAHKDYASATPIQISVYDDKIMLWNPGHLPSGWTAARLLEKHSSEPYNPDVAHAFFRAGMIEAWGRGIEKILTACQAAGVPMPELRYEHTGLWVVFIMVPKNWTGY
jgi:ATP-dependent DNA helicase RecG